MNSYAIVHKKTLNVVTVLPENSINEKLKEVYTPVLLTQEQRSKICSFDILSPRIIDDTIEVFIDPLKYHSCHFMNDIRKKRNTLLSQTDWMVLPDSPIIGKAQEDIRAYRKSLRDLPQIGVHPFDIKIPRYPGVTFPWEIGVLHHI